MAAFLAVPEASAMHADSKTSSSASGGYGFRSAEICFMRKINEARQRKGLGALRWDKQLGYVARRHARQMADNRAVYHDPNMGEEITRWRTLGQNTGAGRNCRGLFRSFMQSSTHRDNILGRWKFLGVGIEYSGRKIFVQQIFELYENPGNIYHWP